MSDLSTINQETNMKECSIVFLTDDNKKEAHVKTVSEAEDGNKVRKKGLLDNLTEYGHYNRDCDEIVHIPEVEAKSGYPVTEILSSAFSYCHNLRFIYIPKTVRQINWNNLGCGLLEGIYVDTENPHYKEIDGVLFTKDGKTLIAYPNQHSKSYSIPNGVHKIASFAFKGCNNLNELTIPDSVQEIGDNTFYRCTSLHSITLPNNIIKVGKYIDDTPEPEPQVIYRGQVYDSVNKINI